MLKTRNISASGTLAELLEPGEDRGDVPRPASEANGAAFGQDPRRVVDQAAAGDVGDAVHDPLDAVMAIDRLDGPDVDPGRLEELVGDGPAQLGDERSRASRPACSKAILRARL